MRSDDVDYDDDIVRDGAARTLSIPGESWGSDHWPPRARRALGVSNAFTVVQKMTLTVVVDQAHNSN